MKRRAVSGIGWGLAGLNGTAGNLLQGMEIRGAITRTGSMVDNQTRLRKVILKLSMLVSCAVLTLTAQEPLQPNLDGFKYPPLARSARIGGTVQFLVNSDGVQLLSGHPMLVPAAKSNLEKWAVPYDSATPLSVTYIFRLTDEVKTKIVEVDQPIGNGFDRFFLRLFRRPVTRRIKTWDCHPKETPAVYKNETKDGLPSIEIEIGSGAMCVEPDVVAIAALRIDPFCQRMTVTLSINRVEQSQIAAAINTGPSMRSTGVRASGSTIEKYSS